MRHMIWILLFAVAPVLANDPGAFSGRLDPHGHYGKKQSSQELQTNSNCKVCHSFNGQKWVTQPLEIETCFNCHNKTPHSGVAEHLKHQKDCLACHTVHRGDAIEYSSSVSRFQSLRVKKDLGEAIEHGTSSAMLKKDCRDCHQWRK